MVLYSSRKSETITIVQTIERSIIGTCNITVFALEFTVKVEKKRKITQKCKNDDEV